MAAVPTCPHCQSSQVSRLPAIFTGITGYRCADCGRVSYTAVGDAARRLAAAHGTHERRELRRRRPIAPTRAKKGRRVTG